jgi:hypothetical protein
MKGLIIIFSFYVLVLDSFSLLLPINAWANDLDTAVPTISSSESDEPKPDAKIKGEEAIRQKPFDSLSDEDEDEDDDLEIPQPDDL